MTHAASQPLPPAFFAANDHEDIDLEGLELVRLICVAYSGKRDGAWEVALERAEARHGASGGAQLFAAVRALMAAIRGWRGSCFDFMNPWCAECRLHVTAHELALLSLISAARRGDRPVMTAQAMVVSEGCACEDVVQTAQRLGRVLKTLARETAETVSLPTDGPGRLARLHRHA
ncbi:hypothetical protein ACKTEK_12055 [Tepidamorphus sp. 3E244]|uniref:hypothetical protein n=1 Tax=Tepidamorphus sp. 3E244 TaxID=3385498 RepID=UPI0038FC2447